MILLSSLPMKKKSASLPLIFLLLVFCCSFNNSAICSSDFNENGRVEKFLKHLMIEEHGIYTLLGSKPMTVFSLIPLIDDFEKKEIYESRNDKFKKQVSFDKFKPDHKDARKLWNDWKLMEREYLGDQFIFIEDADWGNGLFINIPAVVYILEKHYADFTKLTGETFEPLIVVREMGKLSSSFWRKCKQNHYLLGLLLGFGEKNSKLFQLEFDGKLKHIFRQYSSEYLGLTGKAPQELTLEDLDLPAFVSYQPVDDQIEKYRLEKGKILQIYKNQDFIDLTKQFLKGSGPTTSKKRDLAESSQKLIEERTWYTRISMD